MALSTYGELKTSVADWLARTDLTTQIVDFVALAEADIRRDVRTQAMEQLASSTLTGETLAFPTRFLEAKRLVVGGYTQDYVTPDQYADITKAERTDEVYTIIGENFYINDGASGDTYTLIYWQSYAAFSSASDTNGLLTTHPEVYLYGALKHANIFLADDNAVAKYAAAYKAAVDRANARARHQATAGSVLMVRAA